MSTTGPGGPAEYPGNAPVTLSDEHGTDGPSGQSKSRSKAALAALLVVAVIAATAVGFTVLSSSAEAQVTLRSLGSPGDDPFAPSIAPPPSVTLADYANNSARAGGGLTAQALEDSRATPTESATLSDYRTVSGSVPGVFGGSLDERTCDADKLVSFLASDPEKAQAWASVLGIDAGDIGAYTDGLTAANVAADTRVLAHGFASGKLVPTETVLQRGSAVLLDTRGVPRVDCYSGNPLRKPTIQDDETFTGTPWPSFEAGDVVVVEAAPADIAEFVLVDVDDGDDFVRPAGSSGEADVAAAATSSADGDDDDEDDESASSDADTPAPAPTPVSATRELNLRGVVDLNQPISTDILPEDGELIFEFDAPPGAKLVVQLANDRASVGRVAFELMREGQTYGFVRVSQGATESLELTLDHESGGRYELVVTEGPGAFDLIIASEVQNDAGQGRDAGADFGDALAIGSGQGVSGHLAGLDNSDAYVLDLQDAPSLVMTARAARESAARPAFELEILGEAITFFRVNPADEETYELLFGPDDDGLLELYVTEGAAEYEFVVELVPQNDGGSGGDAPAELADALVVDSANDIAGEVGERDQADYYLFEPPADEFTLSIDVSPRATGRIAIDVMRPDGSRAQFFRIEPGATDSITVTGADAIDGNYRIIFSEGRGEYRVSIDS